MTKPHDGTPGDMEREIRELRVWEETARMAWSICTETAPGDCPGPRAVRDAVDRHYDEAIEALARAEKAEAERDAAIEGKAEVFFAVEDRERLEAENATLREHVQVLRASAIGADGHCRLCTAAPHTHRPWCAVTLTTLTEPKP